MIRGEWSVTHGHTRGKEFSPTYSSWTAMIARCTRPSQPGYKNYGGRGITVCQRWRAFDNFLADMGERPDGMTLDRFPDNNGNYEPGNCRWATKSAQNMNKSCNPHFDFNGKRMTIRGWAEELGLDRTTLQKRIYKLGWPIEKALSTNRYGRWGVVEDGKRPGRHT